MRLKLISLVQTLVAAVHCSASIKWNSHDSCAAIILWYKQHSHAYYHHWCYNRHFVQ